MSNEEILSEIGKAMSMMADTKSIVNEALCHAQNIVKKYNEPTISEDTLEMERMKALNEGRNEVWELAKKIAVEPEIGGYDGMQLHDIFGFSDMDGVFTSYSPQEALAKLEAYEKEQNEIKVGDVVESTTTGKEFLIITEENDDSDYEFGVIDLEGMIIDRICNDTRYFKKTGKHIDIQSLLEQIKE